MVQRIYTDPHSPDIFRIKVSLDFYPKVEVISLLTTSRVQQQIQESGEKHLTAQSRSQLVSYGKAISEYCFDIVILQNPTRF